jgi:hypothetical protein
VVMLRTLHKPLREILMDLYGADRLDSLDLGELYLDQKGKLFALAGHSDGPWSKVLDVLEGSITEGLDASNMRTVKDLFGKLKLAPIGTDGASERARVLVIPHGDGAEVQTQVLDGIASAGGYECSQITYSHETDGDLVSQMAYQLDLRRPALRDLELALPSGAQALWCKSVRGVLFYLPWGYGHPFLERSEYRFLLPQHTGEGGHWAWLRTRGTESPFTPVRIDFGEEDPKPILLHCDVLVSPRDTVPLQRASEDIAVDSTFKLTLERVGPGETSVPGAVLFRSTTQDGRLGVTFMNFLDSVESGLDRLTYFHHQLKGQGPGQRVDHFLLRETEGDDRDDWRVHRRVYYQPQIFKDLEVDVFLPDGLRLRPRIDRLVEESLNSRSKADLRSDLLRIFHLEGHSKGARVVCVLDQASDKRITMIHLGGGRLLTDLLGPVLRHWNLKEPLLALEALNEDLTGHGEEEMRGLLSGAFKEAQVIDEHLQQYLRGLNEVVTLLLKRIADLEVELEASVALEAAASENFSAARVGWLEFVVTVADQAESSTLPIARWLKTLQVEKDKVTSIAANLRTLRTDLSKRTTNVLGNCKGAVTRLKTNEQAALKAEREAVQWASDVRALEERVNKADKAATAKLQSYEEELSDRERQVRVTQDQLDVRRKQMLQRKKAVEERERANRQESQRINALEVEIRVQERAAREMEIKLVELKNVRIPNIQESLREIQGKVAHLNTLGLPAKYRRLKGELSRLEMELASLEKQQESTQRLVDVRSSRLVEKEESVSNLQGLEESLADVNRKLETVLVAGKRIGPSVKKLARKANLLAKRATFRMDEDAKSGAPGFGSLVRGLSSWLKRGGS